MSRFATLAHAIPYSAQIKPLNWNIFTCHRVYSRFPKHSEELCASYAYPSIGKLNVWILLFTLFLSFFLSFENCSFKGPYPMSAFTWNFYQNYISCGFNRQQLGPFIFDIGYKGWYNHKKPCFVRVHSDLYLT